MGSSYFGSVQLTIEFDKFSSKELKTYPESLHTYLFKTRNSAHWCFHRRHIFPKHPGIIFKWWYCHICCSLKPGQWNFHNHFFPIPIGQKQDFPLSKISQYGGHCEHSKLPILSPSFWYGIMNYQLFYVARPV